MNLLDLPIEIRIMLYKQCIPDHEQLSFAFSLENRAAHLARILLTQVCKDWTAIDQKYILNSYKEFAFIHTSNALKHFASLSYLNTPDSFESDVKRLLSKNNSVELDFSNMPEQQQALICKKLCEANESGHIKIENLKITAARSLPDLSKLTTLKSLEIADCNELTELPSLSTLIALNFLSISSCKQLKNLQSFDALIRLRKLNIAFCESLIELPLLNTLISLNELDITSCHKLPQLPSLHALVKLTSLVIFDCDSLTHLPSLATLTNLKVLDLFSCGQLNSLPSLDKLRDLAKLVVFYCPSLSNLPPLDKLTSLKTLEIMECSNLTNPISLHALEALEHVQIQNCGIPNQEWYKIGPSAMVNCKRRDAYWEKS